MLKGCEGYERRVLPPADGFCGTGKGMGLVVGLVGVVVGNGCYEGMGGWGGAVEFGFGLD